jgi:TRAP-type C4-dicarboxylate transport system substrate-binding protein
MPELLRKITRAFPAVLAAITLALLPTSLCAEPITLKLSFFTSDRSVAYQVAVKPFVDAVNRDSKGIVQIEVYPSGRLGRVQSELPQLVLDGGADIAFIVPGQNPDRFRDNALIELPGLFRDAREASLIYTRLVAADRLAGYQDFFVIGAFATDPETIHSRKPLATLADLRGQRIRTNNLTEASALARLGALPVVLALNETTPAISSGNLDGSTITVAQLFDVGIGRLVTNHYLLPTSAAPLTLMMNRKVFDALPEAAKSIIRRYSGEWAAMQFAEAYTRFGGEVAAQLASDARRHVVYPSAADAATAARAFTSVVEDWVDDNAHHRALLNDTESGLAKLRAGG